MIYESKRYLEQNQDGIAAFPLMQEMANGAENSHPEKTSMKPVQERHENELHPSQVLDINEGINYYTYGWMQAPESATTQNYLAFGSILLLIAVTLYFIIGTKLVKFIQFFLTQKHYSNLAIKVRIEDKEQAAGTANRNDEGNQNALNIHQTPGARQQNGLETGEVGQKAVKEEEKELLDLTAETAARQDGLCRGLTYHAGELVQFYTPLFAVCQKKSSLALPRYVLLSHLLLRLVILVTLTVAAGYIYLNFALDDQEKDCVLSRDMKNTSYQCLNEISAESSTESHRGPLFAIGGVCAFVGGLCMFAVSQSIFTNFTRYLDKLLQKEVNTETQMSEVIRQINIPSSDTVKQMSPKKKSNKNSPSKRKYDSVSSFRALLDRDSDGSLMNMVDTAGYDSGVSAAIGNPNFLGLGEKAQSLCGAGGGHQNPLISNSLNISQQSSARLTAANTTQCSDVTTKPRAYAAAGSNAVADLLPIDEDVDDEHCSPIKPKKRTQEDSPFKRNVMAQMPMASSDAGGGLIQSQESQLLISDEEIMNMGEAEIAIAKQPSGGESMSFNNLLKSAGIEMTPPKKEDSQRHPSTETFQIMVQKMDTDEKEGQELPEGEDVVVGGTHLESEQDDHFQGLKTLNSGRTHAQLDTESAVEKKAAGGGVTRNHPSIQINSFSGVDDSTLQLETIGAIKPRPTSSSKIAGQKQGQNNEQHSSYFGNQQTEEDQSQQPRVGRYNRPLTSQINLGLMTPFSLIQDNHAGVSHEVQTEDKHSLGIPGVRNAEILSSDQISRISNSMRPESGRRVAKPNRRKAPSANRLPSGFQIQQNEKVESSSDASKQSASSVWTVLAILSFIILVFGVCMAIYLLHSLPSEGVQIILLGLAAAFVSDVIFQMVMLTILSARQLFHALKRRKLPLDTVKLRQMTNLAKILATEVFNRYREQSALLQVGYQDELDIMIDKLERDIEKQQSDSNSESSKAENVGPKDILVKETCQTISINGFTVEIGQRLKFVPPKSQPRHTSSSTRIVRPDAAGNQSDLRQEANGPQAASPGLKHSSSAQNHKLDEDSDQNSPQNQRRKRRADISTFERTQQFFAQQQSKNRLQKVSSPLKRSATILRQSIECIEMEKLESDFPSRPQSKEQIQQLQREKNQTPDKQQHNKRSSLTAGQQHPPPSSSHKPSQFETPKTQQLSQVKLKHGGTANGDDLNANKSEIKSEVRRKLILKRSSNQTIEGSKEESKTIAGKLSAKKNYLEDAIGDTQDLAGMILNNSSKSIAGAGVDVQDREFAGSNYQRSSIEFQDNFGERFLSQDKVFVVDDHYTSHDHRDTNGAQNEPGNNLDICGNETYSPMFSSVNRKPGNAKIDAIKQEYQDSQKQTSLAEETAKTIALNQQIKSQNKIPCQMSRTGYDKSQSLGTADLADKTESKEGTQNSNNLVKAIMSHSKVLSKQQSFNSPNSLHEQLQLTNEKIKKSLEGSSLHKGRRKMVMLDEAGVSKQSLNYGPKNIGTALLNSSAQGIPFLNQSSIGDSSGSRLTPVRRLETAQINRIARVQNSQEALKCPQTAPGRVLMQDQGQSDFLEANCDTPDANSEEDDDELFLGYAAEVAQVTGKAQEEEGKTGAGNDDEMPRMQSEIDNRSSIFNSQAKCSSVQSKQAQSAKTGNDALDPGTVYKDNIQVSSTEKTLLAATETKNSSKTSAFQRLVMASKRMMQKKSSGKKDASIRGQRINSSLPPSEGQHRSQSQETDTIKIMKDQSLIANQQQLADKAIFAQPFRVASRKQKQRSTTQPPVQSKKEEIKPQSNIASGASKRAAAQVRPTKHTIEGLQVLAQKSLESTFNLPDEKCEKISEILEHESMEVDTPMQPTRLQDGSIANKDQTSGALEVPTKFEKEQVNPVKNYANSALLDVPIDPTIDTNNKRTTIPKSKQITTKNSGTSSRDRLSNKESAQNYGNGGQAQHSNRGSQEPIGKGSRGFKQRKNSQVTTKDEKGLKVARRNSKNSHNVPKANGTQEKRKLVTQSSRENTVSSLSIDFDKMDKQRDEDFSDYSKMISAGSTISRLEDQRRRLESFLSLAQQAKSKRDINKIQEMIKQIDETQKPLPMTRINELKLLELMASPYNQSLIAMIKVELDISRKIKELKKTQQQSNHRLTKSKFALPKHLTTQNSQCFVEEVLKTDDSKQTFEKQFEISRPQGQQEALAGNGVLSDNRLTTVVNIRPQGIQSCRSNNDVAPPKTFNRSPSHKNQSPLSVGVCQTVLSGKRPIDKKVDNSSAIDSQSAGGRYSYLRSVGNAVVKNNHEVRKSVDRLRLTTSGIGSQIVEEPNASQKPDLLVESLKQTCLHAENRRGTAPHFGEGEAGRQHLKPDFNQRMVDLSGGQKSPSEFSSAQNIQADIQKRSTTSYGIQQIGPMMHGREGFVKRITPLQSKSAMGQNKENQTQPKSRQNNK